MGRYQEAEALLRESLNLLSQPDTKEAINLLARKRAEPWATGQGMLAWGEHALLQGDYPVAREHFASVLQTISHEYRELVAHAHAGLAAVALAQQQYAQARSEGQTALALFRQMPHVRQHELRAFLQALPEHVSARWGDSRGEKRRHRELHPAHMPLQGEAISAVFHDI